MSDNTTGRKRTLTPERHDEPKKGRMESESDRDICTSDIIPVLDLIQKSDNGEQLEITDILRSIVLMHSSFVTRISSMESKVLSQTEGRLIQVEDSVDKLDSDLGALSTKVNKLSAETGRKIESIDGLRASNDIKLRDMDKRLAAIEQRRSTPVDSSERQLNVVIRNIPEARQEQTANEVNKLLNEGLKLAAVKCESAERKQSYSDRRPGVIIAKFRSQADKSAVMDVKSSLRHHGRYRDVMIFHDKPRATRDRVQLQKPVPFYRRQQPRNAG